MFEIKNFEEEKENEEIEEKKQRKFFFQEKIKGTFESADYFNNRHMEIKYLLENELYFLREKLERVVNEKMIQIDDSFFKNSGLKDKLNLNQIEFISKAFEEENYQVFLNNFFYFCYLICY